MNIFMLMQFIYSKRAAMRFDATAKTQMNRHTYLYSLIASNDGRPEGKQRYDMTNLE